MMVIREIIATSHKEPYKIEFGRIVCGEIDRFYFSVNDETAAIRPAELSLFLDRINAYMGAKSTLFGNNLKSGISTGNADPIQIDEKQPLEQPYVKRADFTSGADL